MTLPATLDHAQIAARIPHQGAMCLLDRVDSWDLDRIVCRAVSHRATDNPLRAAGRLGAANGIEYAAQAMAVHGALLAAGASRPKAGYLTSVRSVNLHVDRLDQVAGELQIVAERLSGDAVSVLYTFTVAADGQLLLDGRATAVLDAGALTSPTAAV
jgi:predicted hotdog family 3-hydroxylacyl-ACP dehydratase